MPDTVRPTPLPLRQKRLFLTQFEKDLDFFKLFFLLVNKSRVTRHMGVLWARDGPAAAIGLPNVVDTQEAMRSPCSRYLQCDPELDPEFCRIVNDYGRHEDESCAASDRAAEKRCRQTGTTQIYSCHAGLVDIAVPVMNGGQYIGTLLCGQVLRNPPTDAGFQQIRRHLSRLTYIDFEKLKRAYWKVPVSSEEDIRNAVQLLEAFAGYLATSWGRLSELVREQHRSIRESQLLCKEFAYLILDGATFDQAAVRDLMDRLGFARTPNRVLAVNVEPEEHRHGGSSFDVASTAALHAVEEAGGALEDVAVAYLRKREICVFFHDSSQAYALAQRVLNAVKACCDLRVRVGIGRAKEEGQPLVESYDEAMMALAQFPDEIAVYRALAWPFEDLSAAAKRVCKYLSGRRLKEARLAMLSLPELAGQRLGGATENLCAQRQFLSSALYSACFCAKELGADRELLDDILGRIDGDLRLPPTPSALHQAYLAFADRILEAVHTLYLRRREKIVELAGRMIDESLCGPAAGEHLSSAAVSRTLGISVSHLDRTFKRVTGVTFERFVMVKRVDMAKRLLLDPALNIAQVAEKCGFSDPAYFSRVFRKLAGCAPREYIDDPIRFGTPPAPRLDACREGECNR